MEQAHVASAPAPIMSTKCELDKMPVGSPAGPSGKSGEYLIGVDKAQEETAELVEKFQLGINTLEKCIDDFKKQAVEAKDPEGRLLRTKEN